MTPPCAPGSRFVAIVLPAILSAAIGAATLADRPGSALAAGMRLTYGVSETDTQPSWAIDSVALGIDAEGRQGCSRIHLRTRPNQPAPEMRLVCASGDTLFAWRAADRSWRPQRPLAPRMTLLLPQADGGVVEVTSADSARVRMSGREFTALETTFLTKNASGAPVRRLTERYVAALHTASEGTFEVPDSTNTGAWRVAQRFRLVRIAGP